MYQKATVLTEAKSVKSETPPKQVPQFLNYKIGSCPFMQFFFQYLGKKNH